MSSYLRRIIGPEWKATFYSKAFRIKSIAAQMQTKEKSEVEMHKVLTAKVSAPPNPPKSPTFPPLSGPDSLIPRPTRPPMNTPSMHLRDYRLNSPFPKRTPSLNLCKNHSLRRASRLLCLAPDSHSRNLLHVHISS